eukprot:scaffold7155_cov138-Isochrysis_galbana.AAC.1
MGGDGNGKGGGRSAGTRNGEMGLGIASGRVRAHPFPRGNATTGGGGEAGNGEKRRRRRRRGGRREDKRQTKRRRHMTSGRRRGKNRVGTYGNLRVSSPDNVLI